MSENFLKSKDINFFQCITTLIGKIKQYVQAAYIPEMLTLCYKDIKQQDFVLVLTLIKQPNMCLHRQVSLLTLCFIKKR